MNIEFDLVRDGESFPVFVEYDYIPASRGHRDRYGCPEEPDSAAEIEIISVKDSEGKEVDLSGGEEDDICEACMEGMEVEIDSAEENAAEERYEARRDNWIE